MIYTLNIAYTFALTDECVFIHHVMSVTHDWHSENSPLQAIDFSSLYHNLTF